MKIVTSEGSQLFKTDKKLIEIRVSVAKTSRTSVSMKQFLY